MTRTGSSKREKKRNAFSISLLLSNLIDDLAPELRGFAEILSADIDNPLAFRETVGNIRAYAEHALMDDLPFYAAIRQVAAVCEKLPSWGAANDQELRERARVKFLDAELRCKRTNKKLRFYSRNPSRIPRHVRIVLNMAVDLIHAALGPCEIDWEECCFGPGVTASTGRSHHEKLVNVSTTSGAAAIARSVLPEVFPRWVDHLLQSDSATLSWVKGDRISFVAKSATTKRTIGIQSSLQVFLQKAVEAAMRPALRRLGVTLDDQERNRLILDMWEEICTIDLTSASDCVAREAVRFFFPPDWDALIFGLSSRFYTFDKKGMEEESRCYHQYHKIAAMGNCTTFPVESLIFAAVNLAATKYCGGDTSLCRTYGDDIITPRNAGLLVIEVLRWLGFIPNREKTFITGPFRESCGRDTLWGVDVRPVYVREIPTDDTAIYGLHNRLLCNAGGWALNRTLRYLRSLVDNPFWGPAWYGAGMNSLKWAPHGVTSDWYAGKSSDVDGFFWSPTPHHEGVVVFHDDTPTTWWWLEHRANVRRFKTPEDESTAYLAFLLGIRGGLEEKARLIGTVSTLFSGTWDWPFSNDFSGPKTRPASTRILRKITAGVIWS